MAISKYDQFDFLIDIVPRDEIKPTKKEDKTGTVLGAEQVTFLKNVLQFII
jgi:nuclear transcription factor Y gamma